jgi:hypothetical protein
MAMRTLTAIVAIASVLVGAAFVSHERNASHDEMTDGTASFANGRHVARDMSQSALERLEHSAKIKAETKRSLGHFELKDGRRVELFIADTRTGRACLVDNDPRFGASAGCLDDGLFRERKVEFSVRFDGGPTLFSELYVAGVVAPSIRSAELTKTDGTAESLELTDSRAFVFESPRADLDGSTYPNGFRLYGPSGKLLETVTFPPVGG